MGIPKSAWGGAVSVFFATGLAFVAFQSPYQNQILITCLTGIILCSIGWVNAYFREEKSKKRAIWQSVLTAYLNFKNDETNSLNRLIVCGVLDLKTEDEIAELCSELKLRNGLDPFLNYKTIPNGSRLKALNQIRDQKIDMNDSTQSAEFLMEFYGI